MSSGRVPFLVLDSSIVYKWFNDEGESHVEQALDLLKAHCRGDLLLAAPAHMPAEVLNGLRYAKLGNEHLLLAPARLAEAEILTVPLDADLLHSALGIALEHGLTVHDAIFPALAAQLDCELVTADRAQAKAAPCPVRLLA